MSEDARKGSPETEWEHFCIYETGPEALVPTPGEGFLEGPILCLRGSAPEQCKYDDDPKKCKISQNDYTKKTVSWAASCSHTKNVCNKLTTNDGKHHEIKSIAGDRETWLVVKGGESPFVAIPVKIGETTKTGGWTTVTTGYPDK